MLKNKKYVTKISNVIIVLMAIIAILGFNIKRVEAIEIDKRNN